MVLKHDEVYDTLTNIPITALFHHQIRVSLLVIEFWVHKIVGLKSYEVFEIKMFGD